MHDLEAAMLFFAQPVKLFCVKLVKGKKNGGR